ncbi:MAG TPA: endonuclease/exonuclease/phosphatase family protein [Anaeromyxobacter sp.]
MRSLLLLLLLLACAPDLGAPRRTGRSAAEVRVATWNVHDLFDSDDRLVPPGELDSVPAPAEVEAKLDALAAVLERIDADVVVLQEVENAALLARLAARAGYPEARLVEGYDPRGIDVAALSRLPVERYVSHLGEVDAWGRPLWPRDCVELHVRTPGRPVVVVASHLSSALSDDGTRRALQAGRLREIADGLRAARPTALVLAGGDLNDRPASAALAPLLEDGAWIDPAPPGVVTWTGASGTARLDYLLLPREERGALSGIGIAAGADVAAASDHRPVVVDVSLE